MAFYTGDNSNNTIHTSTGNDVVNALGGDDWIVTYGGIDVINGGGGNDTLSFMAAGRGVYVDLRKTGAQNTGFGTMTLSGIESLVGSNYSDTLIGNTTDNTIAGWGGDDKLYGREGNDNLRGGLGNDFFDGGGGIDAASFRSTEAAAIKVDLRNTGWQNTGEGWDRFVGIENLFGSDVSDAFTGNHLANSLATGNGDDWLYGAGGSDKLWGGEGRDVFVWQVLDSGVDYIGDFVRGQDKIDINACSDKTWWSIDNLHITYENGMTVISLWADQSKQIKLQGIHDLAASDFIF